jgi:hypothetical protein
MTTLTFPQFDYAQRAQLLAYIKKNKWNYNISEPEEKYNPKFVAKIKQSENSEGVKIKLEDLWK